MLGKGIGSTWSPPTTADAAWTQASVTSGSLKTPSTPLPKPIVDRRAAGFLEAVADVPDVVLDPIGRVVAEGPDRPQQGHPLGDDVVGRPPWMLPKVTTTGSRESTERGMNW